jgi:hypothetical protein
MTPMNKVPVICLMWNSTVILPDVRLLATSAVLPSTVVLVAQFPSACTQRVRVKKKRGGHRDFRQLVKPINVCTVGFVDRHVEDGP